MQVSITYEGPPAQRHVVKATAMAPLSSLLAEACSKMKPPLDPAHAGLVFNKKPLTDLACPFRLANIPNGSSLTLTYSKPASYAVPAAAAAPAAATPASTSGAAAPLPPAAAAPLPPPPQTSPPPSAAPAAAHAHPAALASTAAAATPASAAATPTSAVPSSSPAAVPPAPSPAAPESHPQATQIAAPAPAAATDVSATSTHQHQPMEVDQGSGAVGGSAHAEEQRGGGATAAPAGPGAAAALVPCGDGSSAGEVLGLGRPAVLFSRQALEDALSAAAGPGPSSSGGAATADDEDDAFFEMTPEDMAAMVRANEARKKQEEVGLRTRALREAEERSRAEQYRHVAIRLHLPGGAILQATFAATETVGALRALAAGVLAPQLAPAAYLYTTPPRTVLKGDSDSLYHCGLVPAAHVHVGLDEKKAGGYSGPALRPEAEALVLSAIGPEVAVLHPPHQQHSHVGGQDEDRARKAAGGGGGGGGASGSGQGGAGGSAGPAGRGSGGAAGAAKVPKWLKLGGK